MATKPKKSPEILRNRAVAEILACGRDPEYFISNYCFIQHPKRGLVRFELYDYQKETIKLFLENEKLMANKARQLGFTTLAAALVTWLILFHKDKSVLCLSIKDEVAKELIKRIKVILANLPSWMYLADITSSQARQITLSNGSWVKSIPTSEDAGRSQSLSLLLIDEAAHIRKMEDLWRSISSTVATGGKVMIMSTPKGTNNFFHRYCTDAREGRNGFAYIEVPWYRNPEYAKDIKEDPTAPGGFTSPWFESMTAGWTRQSIVQELLTSFLDSGDNYFDVDALKWYKEMIKSPIEKIGENGNIWVWEKYREGHKYLISLDTCQGGPNGKDFATAVVIDLMLFEIVCEFKQKVEPDRLVEITLSQIAPMYMNPLIVAENTGIGNTTNYLIKRSGYPNLVFFDQRKEIVRFRWDAEATGTPPGFHTNGESRTTILAHLEMCFRKRLIRNYSVRMFNELESFVVENQKPQAMKGMHDDLVMALAVGAYIRGKLPEYAVQDHGAPDCVFQHTKVSTNMHKGVAPANVNWNMQQQQERQRRISQLIQDPNTTPDEFKWIYRF